MIEVECTVRKFPDDAKVGVTDAPEGHADIHRVLDMLEKWADGNLL